MINNFNKYLKERWTGLDEDSSLSFYNWFNKLYESFGSVSEEKYKSAMQSAIGKAERVSEADAVKKSSALISFAIQKIYLSIPGYKPLFQKFPIVSQFGAGSNVTPKIGTMHTNGFTIVYDPYYVVYSYEFMRELYGYGKPKIPGTPGYDPTEKSAIDMIVFVLIHELIHIINLHFHRWKNKPYNSKLHWCVSEQKYAHLCNIAMDFEINSALIQDSRKDLYHADPGGVLPNGGPFSKFMNSAQKEFVSTQPYEKILDWFLSEIKNDQLAKKNKKTSSKKNEVGDLVLDRSTGKVVKIIEIDGDRIKVEQVDEQIDNDTSSKELSVDSDYTVSPKVKSLFDLLNIK